MPENQNAVTENKPVCGDCKEDLPCAVIVTIDSDETPFRVTVVAVESESGSQGACSSSSMVRTRYTRFTKS